MYYAYFIENILYRICRNLQFVLYSFRHFLSVMENITKEANSFIVDLLKHINPNGKSNEGPHQTGTKVFSFSFLKKMLYQKWIDINKRSISILHSRREDSDFKTWCRPLGLMENKEKKL